MRTKRAQQKIIYTNYLFFLLVGVYYNTFSTYIHGKDCMNFEIIVKKNVEEEMKQEIVNGLDYVDWSLLTSLLHIQKEMFDKKQEKNWVQANTRSYGYTVWIVC